VSMNIVRMTPRLLIRVRHFRVTDRRVCNILCDINTHAYQKWYVRYWSNRNTYIIKRALFTDTLNTSYNTK